MKRKEKAAVDEFVALVGGKRGASQEIIIYKDEYFMRLVRRSMQMAEREKTFAKSQP